MSKETNYFDNMARARDQFKKDSDSQGEGLIRNTLEKVYAKEIPDEDYDSFDDAYEAGYEAGYSEGYSEAESVADEAGFDRGYEEGYEDARSEYEPD